MTSDPTFDLRFASTDDLLRKRDELVAEAVACLGRADLAAARMALAALEWATVDGHTLDVTDRFLPILAQGRKIVATFDPRRAPADDEVVIIYGNYPHAFSNVVVNNPIKRHVADFTRFAHDRVESDQRWAGVDAIRIINADHRPDRYDALLRELAAARAPFDRVVRHSAVVGAASWQGPTAGAIGCLRSHINAVRAACEAGHQLTLILEDDFCFTTDLEQHLDDLRAFVQRQYDFWVCLVATSKYGPTVPQDDLVAESHQVCTNAGAYLLSREGAMRVLEVFERALERLKISGESTTYAADRCWRVLQPSGKFLVFRRKFGFQNSSFSDIEGVIARSLD